MPLSKISSLSPYEGERDRVRGKTEITLIRSYSSGAPILEQKVFTVEIR